MTVPVLPPSEPTTPADMGDFRRRVLTALLMTAAVVLSIHLVMNTATVLLLLFISLLLAISLRSLTNLLRDRTPLGDKVAFALVLVGLIVIIVLLVVVIAPDIGEQVDALVERIPDAVEWIDNELRRHAWGRDLLNEIPSRISLEQVDGLVGGGGIVQQITGVFSGVAEVVGMFVIITFTAVFLAVEPRIYFDNFLRLFPHANRPRLRAAGEASYRLVRMWLFSRVISMVVSFTLVLIGLSLAGLPFALTLALIAGVMSFVPTFGPIIAFVPALLVALLESPTTVVAVIAIYLTAEFVDNYVVSPLLARFMLVLPPALIIVAQVLLGVLVGELGLLLAAPIVAAVVPLVRVLYVDALIEGKRTDPAEISA